MNKFIPFFLFVFLLSQPVFAQTSTPSICVDLVHDLSRGNNDTTTEREVTKLQNFLKSEDYLSATPNGNFGPATLAAVKSMQSAYGITPTGTVGPITRLALKVKTCNSTSSANTPPSQNYDDLISPQKGSVLTLGSTQKVSWKNYLGSNQAVILEDEQGVSRGFIVSSLGGVATYEWKVGEVYSAKSKAVERVSPGTYRIRIEDRSAGNTKTPIVGDMFTIAAPELKVVSVFPTSVQKGIETTLVVYGEGLFDGRAYFNVDYYSENNANILYSSPDGKVMVLSIPRTLAAGSHSLIVRNVYGSAIRAGSIQITD